MASSANSIETDLITVLPVRRAERRRRDMSLICPTGAMLAPAVLAPIESRTVDAGLEHPQISILVGDHAVAQAVVAMLQAEGFSARAFTSTREFMAQPEPALGGCLIADAALPGMIGLELQAQIATRQWPLPVILLTPAGDIRTVVRAMKAGAINCLPKPVQRADLLEAVREAFSESNAVRAQRAAQLRVRQLLELLTPREREVLDLAITGLLVKQIAARLGTAEKTVKTHKGRLMRKMQVRSTLGLVQLMIAAGLTPLPLVQQPGS